MGDRPHPVPGNGSGPVGEAIPLSTLNNESTSVGLERPSSHMSQSVSRRRHPPDHPKEELPTIVPCHPHGIKPSGQVYFGTQDLKTAAGFFSLLTDDLILHLLGFLGIPSVLKVGSTCKALWAFSRLDESFWRSKYFDCQPSGNQWDGDWFSTVLKRPPRSHIDCTGLYSDLLYRPFMCSCIDLSPYYSNIPAKNQIPTIEGLTVAEFESKWVKRPFIARQVIKGWPVMRSWKRNEFESKYAFTNLDCEGVKWMYSTYATYISANTDESPLYLFDHDFIKKMRVRDGSEPQLSEGPANVDYWAPECFGKDYFEIFGTKRPDHRWLIVGPEKSGSTFHKDPNGTCAWNAVVQGSKYWIMFPKCPPGVYTSQDQSEVTSPLSIAEWLLGFHAEARSTAGCKEGVCKQGEILYVPSGWFHLVVNLEWSVAITQNFVPRAYLPAALGFLHYKPEQVSGFGRRVPDPYTTLTLRLRKRHPEILLEALEEMDRKYKPHKRRWDEMAGSEDHNETAVERGARVQRRVERVQDWNNDVPAPEKEPQGNEGISLRCFSFCFGKGEESDAEVL